MTQVLRIIGVVILFGLTFGMAQLYKQSISSPSSSRAVTPASDASENLNSELSTTAGENTFPSNANEDSVESVQLPQNSAPQGQQPADATLDTSDISALPYPGNTDASAVTTAPESQDAVNTDRFVEVSDSDSDLSDPPSSFIDEISEQKNTDVREQTDERHIDTAPSLKSDKGVPIWDQDLPPSVKIPPSLPRQKPYGTNLPPSPDLSDTQTFDEWGGTPDTSDISGQRTNIVKDKVFFAQSNHRALRASLVNYPYEIVEVDMNGTDNLTKNSNTNLRYPFKIMPFDWVKSIPQTEYPWICINQASQLEIVTVRFRVDRQGRAPEPLTTSTTNPCFATAAERAVARMQFRVQAAPGYEFGGNDYLLSLVYERPAFK